MCFWREVGGSSHVKWLFFSFWLSTNQVTDFGASRELSHDQYMTQGQGTIEYMAPEVIAGHNYDHLADVYSFGVILWQLVTRAIPFSGYCYFDFTWIEALERLEAHEDRIFL